MPDWKQLQGLRRLLPLRQAALQDVVAVDVNPAATWCVRVRRTGGQPVLAAVDMLPPVDLESRDPPPPLSLPKAFSARYVALAIPGQDAIVKLLNLPGALDAQVEDQIRDHMGIQDGAYRFGYRLISQSRTESRLLTVAVPERMVHAALALFPSGLPAPVSIELSGLAAMTVFLHGPGQTAREDTVGLVDIGARVTYFAFFKKRELILIRKFDFGYDTLLERIEHSMGVDRQTAQDIVRDRSFDISQLVNDLADPFVKQLVISKHFVERRENCLVAKMFVSEDPRVSHEWIKGIQSATGLETTTWRPLEAVPALPGAVPAEVAARPAPIGAALGAALGTLEERQPAVA